MRQQRAEFDDVRSYSRSILGQAYYQARLICRAHFEPQVPNRPLANQIVINNFQSHLSEDLDQLVNHLEVCVPSDATRNLGIG